MKGVKERWELHGGRVVVRRSDDVWVLYDRPGHVLYIGNGEQMLAKLMSLGYRLEREGE